ncbi:unnamed protein product, partial [marine sediment metagenome]
RDNFDSDWNGTGDSEYTCTACHNVHGPPNQAMIRHGELIDKVPALNFTYLPPGADLQNSIGGKIDWDGHQLSQNGVCSACHGVISYYRTPYVAPKVIYPKADPGTVLLEGADQDVLLTCTVLDHDNNLESVIIDLSPIDGSSTQTMYDNGTNGDISTGDNIYSFRAAVPVAAGSGSKSLQITAADVSGQSNQAEIMLQVLVVVAGEIVWEAGTQDITLSNDLNIAGSLTIGNGDTLTASAGLTVGTTLTVNSGGTLVLVGDCSNINEAAGGSAANPYGSGPTITASDIVIASGGSINANGKGFAAQRGPGKGSHSSFRGSGGGYGGTGGDSSSGASGGSAYGSPSPPTALGSGGGYSSYAGPGGGAIKLAATGTITVDGTLSANGGNGWYGAGCYGGGGSGGSIWISSGTLTGSGKICATGGNGASESFV